MKRKSPDWADKVAATKFWNLMDDRHIASALRAAYRRGQREERGEIHNLICLMPVTEGEK